MKIIILNFTLLVLFFNPTFGQIVDSYGLKVGITNAEQNYSNSYTDNISKSILGLDIGVFAEKWKTNFISAQVDFHYTQKGRSFTLPGGTVVDLISELGYRDVGPSEVKVKFHYFTIPILAKLNFNYGKVKPYLEFGPCFNYLIKITEDYNYPYATSINSFSRFDYGVMLNVGTELKLIYIPKMLIEISYNPSFKNINMRNTPSVKNSALSFLLGVVIK